MRYGVGINDVINAINNNTANAGGGRVARGDQSFIVRGVGLVHNLDDLGNIVVTQTKNLPILVRDLGTLSYAHQEPEGILGMNGNPSTIEGIVTGLKYQNVSEVIARIHAKVDELRKQLEPQDVHIVTVLDRGDLVAATVDKIGHTLIEGIGLVIIILILFLGSPRSALVVAVTIPLAVVSIFVLMNAAHMSASMLSLGALDFGVIVDGAIVVTENILRRRESKPSEFLTEDDVRSATSQVARPIFFATLIIITAYFPLFTLQRGEAALFTPMAYTVGFALFGALLCTLALVPGLGYMAFRKPRPVFHNVPLEWLGRAYRAALGGSSTGPSSLTSRLDWRLFPSACSAPPSGETTCRIWTKAHSGFRFNCPAASPLVRKRDGERTPAHGSRVSGSSLYHDLAWPRGCGGRRLDPLAHRGPRRTDAL